MVTCVLLNSEVDHVHKPSDTPARHFEDHHAFICAAMLRRIDALDIDIAHLDAKVEELIAAFAPAVDRLDEIPGVGRRAAEELIAEIGVTMTVFPTAAHLASWAKFAPSTNSQPVRRRAPPPAREIPGWPAHSAKSSLAKPARKRFLGERYRRLARRRGAKRAIVAVGNSVLTIIWHLLSDPDTRSGCGSQGTGISGLSGRYGSHRLASSPAAESARW
jgi:transposase